MGVWRPLSWLICEIIDSVGQETFFSAEKTGYGMYVWYVCMVGMYGMYVW